MDYKISFKEFFRKGKSGRQGTYVYIKSKGKAGRYYRWKAGDSIEGIVAYHQADKKQGSIKDYKEEYGSVLAHKRGKTSSLRKEAQKYKYKKHLGKKFTDILSKGMGTAYIKNIHQATKQEMQQANEIMLKDIVVDPEIRSLVATEENMKKLAHRIQITLKVMNQGNQLLDEIKSFGKTIQEVNEKVKRWLKIGMEVTENYRSTYKDSVNLSGLGKSNVQQEDILYRIDGELLFRKN